MHVKEIEGHLREITVLIRLAEKKRVDYENEVEKNGRLDKKQMLERMEEQIKAETFSDIRLNEDALHYYLESFDFDMIKRLQALMYLGRDEDYNQHESYEERFVAEYNALAKDGWEEKAAEINIMTSKGPLDVYLINGLRIIGLAKAYSAAVKRT